MRVKTFEAASMQEALNIVKQDMGEEAFILSTRTRHRKAASGLGEEAVIEVTAAVDEAPAGALGLPGNGQDAGNGLYGLRPPLSVRPQAVGGVACGKLPVQFCRQPMVSAILPVGLDAGSCADDEATKLTTTAKPSVSRLLRIGPSLSFRPVRTAEREALGDVYRGAFFPGIDAVSRCDSRRRASLSLRPTLCSQRSRASHRRANPSPSGWS